jgi:hypothetical protein
VDGERTEVDVTDLDVGEHGSGADECIGRARGVRRRWGLTEETR